MNFKDITFNFFKTMGIQLIPCATDEEVHQEIEAYSEKIQTQIYNVKPGLTGIRSIIFRDEETLISAIKDEDPHANYQKVIAPYKGELEICYQKKQSFIVDFKTLLLTVWVVLFPKTKLIYKFFKGLPKSLNS